MKSIYTSFIADIIFPFHEWLKKHSSVAIRKEMEQTQWWEKSKIEKHQIEQLQKLLKNCIDNVPYYQKLFNKLAIDESNFNTLSDLQKLPLMDKNTIKKNTEELKSLIARDLSRGNTGGSSGEPLIFFIGKERTSHDVAAKWRATRWWDVDIGDKEIVLWGSPIELSTQDYVRLIRDKLIRTQLLSAFELNEEKINDFLKIIKKTRPAMLFGYPSVMSMIAEYADKHNICLQDLGIKVAFVTSERLYDYQRKQIEQTFNCPVANGYGGRDAGFIAHQCPAGSMHITAEDIIVEIIDNEGNVLPEGEQGEIVVTQLFTSDFPFIRYRTGDIGVLSNKKCSCGRGLPILKEIQGRTTDFIYASNGTAMHGLSLIYILRDFPGVSYFKIIQQSLTLVQLQLVKNGEYKQSDTVDIIKKFKQRLGDDVDISIEYLMVIPAEASGKYRYVINNMSQ